MTNNQTNNVTAEEIQEKKHKLLAWLKELVSIFKSPACFEALKRCEENLELLTENNAITAETLDNLLDLTSELKGKIGTMDEHEIEEEIEKINDAITKGTSEKKIESSFSTAFDQILLCVNGDIKELALCKDASNDILLKVVTSDDKVWYSKTSTFFAGNEVNVSLSSPVDEYHTKMEVIQDLTPVKDNAALLERNFLKAIYPDIDDVSHINDKETKETISKLETKIKKLQAKRSFNNKYKESVVCDDNPDYKARFDGKTFYMENVTERKLIKAVVDENKNLTFTAYENYDNQTYETIGRGINLGRFVQRPDSNRIKAEISLDKDRVFYEALKTSAFSEYLYNLGLDENSVEVMLHRDGKDGFHKVTDERAIKRIINVNERISKILPKDYFSKLVSDDSSTYIKIQTPSKKIVYISFKENGDVDRYSLWTPQKKDIKPVIERDTKNGEEIGDTSGVIGKNAKIISEKGCQDEEFKRCVASFEKAFDKERKVEAKSEKKER